MPDNLTAESDGATLAQCPIGLFTSKDGELCLKTEYGNNEGRIDAYIVSSGEFFWGPAPQTIASQRSQVVYPFDLEERIATAEREARVRGLREALDVKIALGSIVTGPVEYEIFDAGRQAKVDAIRTLIVAAEAQPSTRDAI